MDKIKELLADIQAKLAETVKGVDDKPLTILDAFKMFPELQTKYGELETRLKEIETQGKTRKWADVPGLDLEKKSFSICRALRAIRSGKAMDEWDAFGAGLEAEVFKTTKAMSTGTDSEGGYLVPMQAMPEFIEMFREEAVCVRMGARLISGLVSAPVVFAKQTGGASFYWTGENKEIIASMLEVGQLKMVPKKLTGMVQISNELVRMSSPDAESMVRQDLAMGAALAVDTAGLRGIGSENQPLGVANTSGINTVTLGTGSGAVPDFVNPWPDMEYELSVDKALRGKLGFIFHPAIKRVLKKLRNPYFSGDTGGEYPMLPLTDAQLQAVLGYPFANTTELPINLVTGGSTNCTEIFFGNWAEMLIGQWLGFEILGSNVAGTSFAFDQTWVRIITQVDIALRHAESFCLCNTARIAAA
ncbi:MAG: phage major capsid protein [Candidatus Micrarchaeia archaeon]|jgi:HK97 family phage major capsid protein